MAESNRDAPLCPCGFWGSVQTSGLCSKCYKEMLMKQECSGCSLHNSSNNGSSTSVTDNSKTQQQVTQKMSENFDLIFSSNHHNNKPQANRNPSSLDVAAVEDEVDLNTADADVITSEMPALTMPTTTPAISVTRVEPTTLTSLNNNITSPATTPATTQPPAPPITIVAPTAATPTPSSSKAAAVAAATADQQNSESPIGNHPRTSISLISTAALPSYALSPSSSSVPSLAAYTEAGGSNTDTSTVATTQTSNTTDSNLSRPAQRNRKRCFKCNYYVFCDLHRLPEQHDCTYDHKTEGRQDARNKMVSPKKHMGTTLKRLDS
ncbi:hypothetical protein HELRODRAFT_194255 [Helobdella robusta]|uniref:A20-type domain-containing protein n=1 Tax=Helobdella robusta TaxID=6412 RepID=T1FVV5_HELRO|nr:hypothetical protein HELRODRAFT_194255 [Helobdella robusta]ESN92421.1 hypothetical protein HELRODRAFT_194255 [Helobdella robusta]